MELDHSSGFSRLFIALPLPDEVRAEMTRAQGRLKRVSPPGTVRWTRPDQFHITLKFLGDVPIGQIDDLKKSVTTACADTLALRLSARGIGFFPNERSPRVIWIGANDDQGALTSLNRKLCEALRWLVPKEKPEKFIGHITLGRFKPGQHAAMPNILEQAESLQTRYYGSWLAHKVEIMRSDLTANGANHVTLASCSLVQISTGP